MRDELESLKDQSIEVTCNGIAYKGRLVGSTEEEVHLQTAIQFLALPMAGISQVKKSED
ncbi:MAG TPA: hypothetical protein VGB26_08945 [Nitrospiria bacterium]